VIKEYRAHGNTQFLVCDVDIAERQGITSADFIHLLDSGMQISDFLAAMNPLENGKRTLDCDS